MKRLGLIGFGAWGKRYADTISRRGDSAIVAFARSSASGDEKPPGAQRFPTWRAMMDAAVRDGMLDGIIAATTPDNQAEVALAAVRAGIPALIEKPLGTSRAAAEAVLDVMLATERPSPVMVDYIQVFAPGYRQLASLVNSAERRVVTIAADGSNNGPFRHWSPLHDYASHDVAMCLDLLGRDAAFRLRDARLVSAANQPGRLYEFRFDLNATHVVLRTGNGASSKSRKFVVRLDDEHELVYDDTVAHPNKLTDNGHAVSIDVTSPLDVVLTRFFERCDDWASSAGSAESSVDAMRTATRVAEILDALAAAVS